MKKSTIIIILLIVVLLLAGCKSKQKTSGAGFIGGKEGLKATLAIESTSGGNKVYDAGVDNFKIDLTLENSGEDDVDPNEVLVTLERINFDAFGIDNPTQSNTLPLPGKRKEASGVTAPSQTIVQYDAVYGPDDDADRNVELLANFCYEYETKARVSGLCLKNKVTGPSSGTACRIDEVKAVENSGSPFQVKTFTESPAGEKKVAVFLQAENAGKGIIYNKDYLSKGKCIDSDSDKNKVYVKVELLDFLDISSSMIKCSGLNNNEGLVTVIQNKLQLRCEIDTSLISQETAFETPLRATFNYVYKDSVSTTLNIKGSI